MCSKPSMPSTTTAAPKEEVVQTKADANTSKAGAINRSRNSSLGGRDVRTSSRGLNDVAVSQKKQLLGD